jgi:hypothetical protein
MSRDLLRQFVKMAADLCYKLVLAYMRYVLVELGDHAYGFCMLANLIDLKLVSCGTFLVELRLDVNQKLAFCIFSSLCPFLL